MLNASSKHYMIREFVFVFMAVFLAVGLSGQNAEVRESSAENWSAISSGVRGRLIVTPLPDPRGPQFRLEFEIQNTTNRLEPIEIGWGHWNEMLTFAVEEESGKPLSLIEPGGSRAVLPAYWMKLPPQSSMRATVSNLAIQYIPPQDRLYLRPTVFQGWFLPEVRTGRFYLSAVFTPQKPRDRSRSPWVGRLVLPRVALP